MEKNRKMKWNPVERTIPRHIWNLLFILAQPLHSRLSLSRKWSLGKDHNLYNLLCKPKPSTLNPKHLTPKPLNP